MKEEAMKVKWLGHASMLLTSSGGFRVVTDPYTPGSFGLNYAPIDVEADIVTVSHDHADHNNAAAVKGKPDVVKGGGVYDVRGVTFQGIDCYHDDSSGSQRGSNTIFCFSLDDIRVCHLGDLGHPLRPEDRTQIGPVDLLTSPVDVLFIPVGGSFTIDASVAAETCRMLKPKVVIPMHYRNDRCPEFPVAEVDDFLALMDEVRQADGSEVEFHKDSLPDTTEVVVLDPAL
jgi:L-ascorbate metabolism protein UlaG (beta-lactamase superfamily)